MISLMEYQLSTLLDLVVEDVVRVLGNKIGLYLICAEFGEETIPNGKCGV